MNPLPLTLLFLFTGLLLVCFIGGLFSDGGDDL